MPTTVKSSVSPAKSGFDAVGYAPLPPPVAMATPPALRYVTVVLHQALPAARPGVTAI
jgi:hypothetical protein